MSATRTVLSVRVDPETRSALDADAARLGTTVSKLAAERLAAPSWSDAFAITSDGVLTETARADRVALSEHPKALGITSTALRATAAGLTALANRWPR